MRAGSNGGYLGSMFRLLLNLRNVPEDGVDDAWAMLDARGIAFHETTPSPWNVSSGGSRVTEGADFRKPSARSTTTSSRATNGVGFTSRRKYFRLVRHAVVRQIHTRSPGQVSRCFFRLS
jgi:hypothetical protein